MFKGGYQIIDLNDVNHVIGSDATVHKGIYDKIKNTRKAILLSGVVVGGTEYHDMFVPCRVQGSDFVIVFDTYTMLIKNTDEVSFYEYGT